MAEPSEVLHVPDLHEEFALLWNFWHGNVALETVCVHAANTIAATLGFDAKTAAVTADTVHFRWTAASAWHHGHKSCLSHSAMAVGMWTSTALSFSSVACIDHSAMGHCSKSPLLLVLVVEMEGPWSDAL